MLRDLDTPRSPRRATSTLTKMTWKIWQISCGQTMESSQNEACFCDEYFVLRSSFSSGIYAPRMSRIGGLSVMMVIWFLWYHAIIEFTVATDSKDSKRVSALWLRTAKLTALINFLASWRKELELSSYMNESDICQPEKINIFVQCVLRQPWKKTQRCAA